jgi:hypothetical protein
MFLFIRYEPENGCYRMKSSPVKRLQRSNMGFAGFLRHRINKTARRISRKISRMFRIMVTSRNL